MGHDVYETTARAILTQGPVVLVAGKTTESFYVLPGGHVEAGENPLEAVRREVEEEVGEMMSALRKLTVLPNLWMKRGGDMVHEIMHLYAAAVRQRPTGVLPRSPERQTVLRWATIDDIYAGRVVLVPSAVWPWIIHSAGR